MQVIHNAEETGACGAVGSALPWHGRGREFESHQVHQNISNTYRSLPSQTRSHRSPTGVQTQTVHGQPWAPMWISMLPTTRPLDSMSWRVWAVSPENARRHRVSRVVGRVTIRFTPVAGTSKAILMAIGKATGGDGGAPGADCRRENRPGTPGGTVNRAQLGIHSRDLLPAARSAEAAQEVSKRAAES